MRFFDLPPELVHEVVQASISARSFRRAMRLRLVSRAFRDLVDETILISRMLDDVVGPGWHTAIWITSSCPPNYRLWRAYFQRYLAERIFRHPSPDPLCEESHLRRVAERVAGLTGDTSKAAMRRLIRSLVGMWSHPDNWCILPVKTREDRLYRLIAPHRGPIPPLALAETDLRCLTLDAVIYLRRPDLVRQLLADDPGREVARRQGAACRRLELAAYVGSIEILQLLLLMDIGLDAEMDGKVLKREVAASLIRRASIEGHHDFFNYILDIARPFNLSSPSLVRYRLLGDALRETAFPEDFKRLAGLFNLANSAPGFARNWKNTLPPGSPRSQLSHSTRIDRIEIVRYFLRQGIHVDRDPVVPFRFAIMSNNPVLGAIKHSRNLDMLKLLLDHGADPNGSIPACTPLLAAIGRRSLAMAKLLVEYGADINNALPPPIVAALLTEDEEMFYFLRRAGAILNNSPQIGGRAMSLVRASGLESMEALLQREGIDTESLLYYVPTEGEVRWKENVFRTSDDKLVEWSI